MKNLIDKTKQIETAALQLGATEFAIQKWVQRGVPAKWQLEIFKHTKGSIGLDDFSHFMKDAQ